MRAHLFSMSPFPGQRSSHTNGEMSLRMALFCQKRYEPIYRTVRLDNGNWAYEKITNGFRMIKVLSNVGTDQLL